MSHFKSYHGSASVVGTLNISIVVSVEARELPDEDLLEKLAGGRDGELDQGLEAS